MSAPSSKTPTKKAFALRLDPAVHAAIERLAGAELRSANAQIEIMLREALSERGIEVRPAKAARRGRPPRDSSPTDD